MMIHPEVREQFEAEFRENMRWYKTAPLTATEIYEKQLKAATKEQAVLLRNPKNLDLTWTTVLTCGCLQRNAGVCHDFGCQHPTKIVFSRVDPIQKRLEPDFDPVYPNFYFRGLGSV